MIKRSFFVGISIFLILATSCQFNCPCKDKIVEPNKSVPEQNLTEKELDTEIKLNIEGASQLYIVESKNTDSVSQRNAKVAYIPTESKLYMLKKQNGGAGNLVEEAVSYINSKGEQILDLIPKEIVKINSKYVLIKFMFLNIPKGFIVNKTNGKAYSFDLRNESDYFFYETNKEDIVYYHERGYTPGSLKLYGSIKKLDFTNSEKGIETEVTRPDIFTVAFCEVDKHGNIVFNDYSPCLSSSDICITHSGVTFFSPLGSTIISPDSWWTSPLSGNICYISQVQNDLNISTIIFEGDSITSKELGVIKANDGESFMPMSHNIININKRCYFTLEYTKDGVNYFNIYCLNYGAEQQFVQKTTVLIEPLNKEPIVEICANNVNTVFNNKVYIATGDNVIKCIDGDNKITDITINEVFKITNLSGDSNYIYFTAMDHQQNDVLGKIDKEHNTTILENKQIRKIKELQSIN